MKNWCLVLLEQTFDWVKSEFRWNIDIVTIIFYKKNVSKIEKFPFVPDGKLEEFFISHLE